MGTDVEERLEELEQRLGGQECLLAEVRVRVRALERENAAMKERVGELEKRADDILMLMKGLSVRVGELEPESRLSRGLKLMYPPDTP